MTGPSNSAVQNLLPVQAYFTLDGQFSNFIGQGVPFYPTINFSNVTNQPVIEVYDRSASIPLTATPALLKPATTLAGSNGITYDAANGEFTFQYAGSYTLALNVNATASAAGQFVYIYAEKNTGSGWVLNQNSGKVLQLLNNQLTQLVYANAIARQVGEKTRYWIYSNDGKVELQTATLPGTSTVYVPAIRIQFS